MPRENETLDMTKRKSMSSAGSLLSALKTLHLIQNISYFCTIHCKIIDLLCDGRWRWLKQFSLLSFWHNISGLLLRKSRHRHHRAPFSPRLAFFFFCSIEPRLRTMFAVTSIFGVISSCQKVYYRFYTKFTRFYEVCFIYGSLWWNRNFCWFLWSELSFL